MIANLPSPVESVKTKVNGNVKMSLISLLISRILQKLVKSFNETIISTSFVLPSAGGVPVFRFKLSRIYHFVRLWILP